MTLTIKYAPKSLSDVVFPSAAAETRITAIATGAGAQSTLLLYGPNRTGKSVLTTLLAQQVWHRHDIKPRVFGPNDYKQLGTHLVDAVESEISWQLTEYHVTKPAVLLDEIDACKCQGLVSDLYNKWQHRDWQWYAATNKLHNVEPSLAARLGKMLYQFSAAEQFADRVHQICVAELGPALTPPVQDVAIYLDTILVPNNADLGWHRAMEAAAQIVMYQQGTITKFYPV